MLEPIQGESGIHPIADEVLVAAREACDEAGALLVFDEIQTGMGRTGTLWAYEGLPVRPDVMTAGKALGGGLPVGACVIDPEVGEGLTLGEHGSTFAGGPICARAALEALGDPLRSRAPRGGARARRPGPRRPRRARAVTEIRGPRPDDRGGLADGLDSREVAAAALDGGLVVNAPNPATIRLLPALTIGADELARGPRSALRGALDACRPDSAA